MAENTGVETGALCVRAAERRDLPVIAAIYDHYVLNSTCTFATAPESAAYWDDWFAKHAGDHPALVGEHDGGVVVWGTLSEWNRRCAYRRTVEDSVYVDDKCRGRGYGRAMLSALIAHARDRGHRSIIAQIAADQAPSERLHAKFGFERIGVLKSVGFKFDRWLDVSLWQLQLVTF